MGLTQSLFLRRFSCTLPFHIYEASPGHRLYVTVTLRSDSFNATLGVGLWCGRVNLVPYVGTQLIWCSDTGSGLMVLATGGES